MARLARFNRTTATEHPLTAQADPNQNRFEFERARWRCALVMSRSRSPSLGAPAKLLALVLLEHANREHFYAHSVLEAWPDRETLADLTGRSEGATKETLRVLLKSNAVFVVHLGGHGARDSNRYRFNNRWLDQTEGELAVRGLLRKWPDNRLKGAQSRPHAKGAEFSPHKGAETRKKRGRIFAPEPTDRNHMKQPPERELSHGGIVASPRNRSSLKKAKPIPREKQAELRLARFRLFTRSAETLEWASVNCPDVDDPCGAHHLSKFVNHFLATGKIPQGDFDAAFRVWLAREQEFTARHKQQHPRPRGGGAMEAIEEELENE
jgi:hypothetical protein